MHAAYHIPVLADEIAEYCNLSAGNHVLDLTLGGGGHAKLLGDRIGNSGVLVAFDRDKDAIEAATNNLKDLDCALNIYHRDFGSFSQVLSDNAYTAPFFHFVLADLGVSSHQLDDPQRGFSIMRSGPVDMRMGQTGITAKELIAETEESELARILGEYGDVYSKKLVRALKNSIDDIENTADLARLCENVLGRSRKGKPHVATQIFQALRIAVNDEIGQLQRMLADMAPWIYPGGRLAVISFHSGEDRIVKNCFKNWESPCTCPPKLPLCVCCKQSIGACVNKKPLTASETELADNSRAACAKLRIFEFSAPHA